MKTAWQKMQYKRLLVLLNHADTLADEPRRRLGMRLIQITRAVDALVSTYQPAKASGNHNHVVGLIAELEAKHLRF